MFNFLYFYIIFIFTNVLTFVIFNGTLKINPALTSIIEEEYPGLEWCLLYLRRSKYVMKDEIIQLDIIYWFAEGTAAVSSTTQCSIIPQMASNCIVFVRLRISTK